MTIPEDLRVNLNFPNVVLLLCFLLLLLLLCFLADVSAEELFNMFFGGSFGGQNVYVRRGRQWERQRAEATNQVSMVYGIVVCN